MCCLCGLLRVGFCGVLLLCLFVFVCGCVVFSFLFVSLTFSQREREREFIHIRSALRSEKSSGSGTRGEES